MRLGGILNDPQGSVEPARGVEVLQAWQLTPGDFFYAVRTALFSCLVFHTSSGTSDLSLALFGLVK